MSRPKGELILRRTGKATPAQHERQAGRYAVEREVNAAVARGIQDTGLWPAELVLTSEWKQRRDHWEFWVWVRYPTERPSSYRGRKDRESNVDSTSAEGDTP